MSTETIAAEDVAASPREDVELEAKRLLEQAEEIGIDITGWKPEAAWYIGPKAIEVTLATSADHSLLREVTEDVPVEMYALWFWIHGGPDDSPSRLAIPYEHLSELNRCLAVVIKADSATFFLTDTKRGWAVSACIVLAGALALNGHFRLAAGFALAPMLLTAAVVLAHELRAVLGRLPSRDFESGDRGAPGLPGQVLSAELPGQSPLSAGQLSGQVTAVSGQVSSGQVS